MLRLKKHEHCYKNAISEDLGSEFTFLKSILKETLEIGLSQFRFYLTHFPIVAASVASDERYFIVLNHVKTTIVLAGLSLLFN